MVRNIEYYNVVGKAFEFGTTVYLLKWGKNYAIIRNFYKLGYKLLQFEAEDILDVDTYREVNITKSFDEELYSEIKKLKENIIFKDDFVLALENEVVNLLVLEERLKEE